MLYIFSTALAILVCPAFLLLDPVTSWNEASSVAQGVLRLGCYLIAPHKFVLLCVANRFRAWQRMFLATVAVHVVADFASCLLLGSLILDKIREGEDVPSALFVGCVQAPRRWPLHRFIDLFLVNFALPTEFALDTIRSPAACGRLSCCCRYASTAFGFVLGFGPYVCLHNLQLACSCSTRVHKCHRICHAVLASIVVLALCYLCAGLALLIAKVDIVRETVCADT